MSDTLTKSRTSATLEKILDTNRRAHRRALVMAHISVKPQMKAWWLSEAASTRRSILRTKRSTYRSFTAR